MSSFQKFSSPHTSPFESSSSVLTYSRMLFGNEYFSSRILMGLESVYNSLSNDSFKMTGTKPWLRRKRERQKHCTFLWDKQQLCTCITLFCTFLRRHCTTTTWKYLISRLSLKQWRFRSRCRRCCYWCPRTMKRLRLCWCPNQFWGS